MGLASAIGARGGSTPSTPVESTKTPAEPQQPAAAPAGEAEAPLPPPAYEAALPGGVRSLISTPFTGDLDQMVARRLIRVGVTYNRTFYFADKGGTTFVKNATSEAERKKFLAMTEYFKKYSDQ